MTSLAPSPLFTSSPPPPSPLVPNVSSSDPICFNATVFEQYIRGLVNNVTDEKSSRARRREVEGDPLVYIVAVLLFYSCGIAVLMINYMKKARRTSSRMHILL